MTEFNMLVNILAETASNFDIFKLLVTKYEGYSPNFTDRYGNTPLHMAVLHNKPKLVRFLLDIGACPRICNNAGKTAMDLCPKLEQLKVAAMLIKSCSDEIDNLVAPDARDKLIKIPCVFAPGKSGYKDMVNMLYSLGMSISKAKEVLDQPGCIMLFTFKPPYSEDIDLSANPLSKILRKTILSNINKSYKIRSEAIIEVINSDPDYFLPFTAYRIANILRGDVDQPMDNIDQAFEAFKLTLTTRPLPGSPEMMCLDDLDEDITLGQTIVL